VSVGKTYSIICLVRLRKARSSSATHLTPFWIMLFFWSDTLKNTGLSKIHGDRLGESTVMPTFQEIKFKTVALVRKFTQQATRQQIVRSLVAKYVSKSTPVTNVNRESTFTTIPLPVSRLARLAQSKIVRNALITINTAAIASKAMQSTKSMVNANYLRLKDATTLWMVTVASAIKGLFCQET